jgi:acyl carrier protein
MSETAQTSDETLMAERLIQALNLDHLMAPGIAPTAALFGNQDSGLGLDSIDALEIALMVQQNYGVTLKSDDPNTMAALASLRTLTNYALANRTK